jgi:CelD/BcsL family acetyltransferase involved in cellulose biosynthesis
VHHEDRLVAAAPLAVESSGLGAVIAKAGVPGEPYGFLHSDHETGSELARAVAGAVSENGWMWRLHVTDLPADDRCTDELVALLGRARRHEASTTPHLDVGPGADPRERPSRNTRQADAKARNRIVREGHRLEQRWTSDPAEIRAVLPGLVRLHVRRNEDLDRAALLRIPRQRDLFMDTVLGHADDRRVRLLLTHIDDRLAAFALCLESGSRWWVYANYADPEFLRYSPGTITNAEVVRSAYADPAVTVLDWGAGLQRYKLSGGAELATRQSLVAESSLVVRALQGTARRLSIL